MAFEKGDLTHAFADSLSGNANIQNENVEIVRPVPRPNPPPGMHYVDIDQHAQHIHARQQNIGNETWRDREISSAFNQKATQAQSISSRTLLNSERPKDAFDRVSKQNYLTRSFNTKSRGR